MPTSAESTPAVEDFRHGRVPRAVREEQILRLAEELFAERGYERASMDELAQRAGVSKPVIYDLVGNKEALFLRCFERSGEELDARVVAAVAAHEGDLAGEVRATARAFFEFIEEHERAWAMLFSLDTGGRTEASVGAIRRRQAEYTAGRIVQRAAEHGVKLDPLRANAAAVLLNSGYEALAHWRRDHPETSVDQLTEWLVEFVVPGLEGLLR
jgi:AcrR family transcriptional regulator